MADGGEDMERNALGLLRWYAAMGVDEAVSDSPLDWSAIGTDPRDRLARQAAPPPRSQAHEASAPQIAPGEARAPAAEPLALRDAPAVQAARELAREARDLAALERALAGFHGCPLRKTAKNLCFARGNPDARLMLIGEAPGRDEDLSGQPFVGRAGQLLDRMLAAIGLGPDEAYITNVVYWRPPGNRTPTPQEVQACQPFLQRQIELVAPDILVLLGGAAAKQMFGTDQGIMKLRGKWRSVENAGQPIRALATLHPAYLLRNPVSKRLAWRDLLTIRAALDEAN